MVVDEAKLEQFIGKAVGEWGAAMGAMLILVGDRLGLFKAMAGAGPYHLPSHMPGPNLLRFNKSQRDRKMIAVPVIVLIVL